MSRWRHRVGALPLSVTAPAVGIMIAGLFFFLLALHAWINGLSFWGLSGGSILTVSVLCIGVGEAQFERVGILRAMVVCAPVIVGGLIGAFTGGEAHVVVAQCLLGALGLWLLLRTPAPTLRPGRHMRAPGEEAA